LSRKKRFPTCPRWLTPQATLLHLPALSVTSGKHLVMVIDPVEWPAVLESDERD
jgi:hypothetical protein